jgi:alpha-tubulin suppressor-like RCC1 family protein
MSGALAGKKIRSFATNQDGQYVCVIASDNNAYCWGAGTGGQLGNGASVNSNVPVAVSTSGALAGKTIKELHVVGTSGTCAVASDNNLYCWGTNTNGQLGNGSVGTSNVPVAVSTSGALAGKTIKQVSLGTAHRCVVASDSNAYCWGTNTNGQLGDGSITSATTPVAVSRSGVLAGKTIRSIQATTGNTCAIASDNNAYCWGLGTSGQLGNGASVSSSSPVGVSAIGVLSGKFVQSLHGGNGYTCVIASDSAVYCWGLGTSGQLGNGASAISNVPVAVSTSGVLSGKTISSVSTLHSTASTCAVTGDGGAFCWGINTSGQLGNGNTTTQNAPVAVSTSGVLAGKKFQKIEISGSGAVCAIASDNNIYCWGAGTNGQLGNGASSSSNVPVMVTRPSGL